MYNVATLRVAWNVFGGWKWQVVDGNTRIIGGRKERTFGWQNPEQMTCNGDSEMDFFLFVLYFLKLARKKYHFWAFKLDPPFAQKAQLDSASFVRVRAVISVVMFDVSVSSFFLAWARKKYYFWTFWSHVRNYKKRNYALFLLFESTHGCLVGI